MATNPFISFYDNACKADQTLLEDLIQEAVSLVGVTIKYLPRNIQAEDYIFGDDVLSIFDTAVEMEAYFKSVEGWEGEGDILSQVGLDIRDRLTLSVSQSRWAQLETEKLIFETGMPWALEPAEGETTSNCYFLMESGSANGYTLSSRPLEGDLVYIPMMDKIFQIRFVEHEDLFYQFGKLMTYDLVLEKWDYNQERIDTGDPIIDAIEDEFSSDIRDDRIVLETGDALILEGTGNNYLILEADGARVENVDKFANNEAIENVADGFIDFNERHPFQRGRFDF